MLGLLTASPADAQRRRESAEKPPKIMEDLPAFFVSDERLPDYLKAVYKRDATRIAVRLLNKELRLSKQTVMVPEELVQALYNALIAVRSSDFNAVDSIASKYNVRSFPVPNVENIILVFQHDDPRLETIKKQRRDTLDDPNLNNIIRQYDLYISKMSYLDEERVGLILQTRQPVNVPALAYRFFTSEGIGSIEEVLPYGDGNDINIERTKNGWNMTYSVKFGNCINQCQKSHDWKFQVSNEGEVAYLGSQGHVIPPWLGPLAHLPKDELKK